MLALLAAVSVATFILFVARFPRIERNIHGFETIMLTTGMISWSYGLVLALLVAVLSLIDHNRVVDGLTIISSSLIGLAIIFFLEAILRHRSAH